MPGCPAERRTSTARRRRREPRGSPTEEVPGGGPGRSTGRAPPRTRAPRTQATAASRGGRRLLRAARRHPAAPRVLIRLRVVRDQLRQRHREQRHRPTQASPPLQIAGRVPVQLAMPPARTCPSCGPTLYDSTSIPASRPRRASGTVWFQIVERPSPLIMSPEPASARKSSTSQMLSTQPAAAIARPQPPAPRIASSP
ncbi:hypothetical protein NKH77_15260 [Streptomyces sp. M19]